ncbi:peptidoglycan bridge formation glycyltransferase FemA/FemB family protein [Enterococcus sp. AZ102]|uniref:peptidoglycan bridge formation glycyltransferase FemA/FemB family protein n=1 Tax=unclassified Enterococcus TaxID=2608891 RepID=UPI003F202269
MKYELKPLDETTYDEFNRGNQMATLLQSYQWSTIKEGWGSLHLGIYVENVLSGTMLVLKRHLPLGRSMLYIPKGPIMDYDPELMPHFVQELKKIAKKEHAVFVKMDPPILRRKFYVEETDTEILNESVAHALIQAGFEQGPLTLNLHDTIQPRFQAVVALQEFDLTQLTKKGRQGVKTAIKRGVTVKRYGVEKVDEFAALMEKTAERQGISLRGKDYFKRLLETYPESFLMLGTIDLGKRQQEVQAALNQTAEQLAQLAEHQTKKRTKLLETSASLEKEAARLVDEIAQHGTGELFISGTLSIPYGQTSELLYAGMDETFKHYMPAYLTWYASMEEAAKSYQYCNLGGIDGHLNDGLIGFKKNFHPEIHEYSGEFDLPTTNRLVYGIIKKAYEKRTQK